MPCVIDVGTNNQSLLDDPRYLGLKQPRLEGLFFICIPAITALFGCQDFQAHFLILGDAYYAVIDEFMAAINLRWPKALIQHEDFQSKHAVNLLKRYRYSQ